MGKHPIPEPFVWEESFKVFYENLDEEHRGLFDGIFKCAADRGNKGLLEALANKVKAHFTNEEKMMDKASYACADHKQKHADFVTKLNSLSTPLDDGSINFAKEWLVDHIKETDFKYKGKL